MVSVNERSSTCSMVNPGQTGKRCHYQDILLRYKHISHGRFLYQDEMSWLKRVAYLNMDSMDWTLDTSQDERSWLKLLASLNM
jgi:hypothetical protein